MTSIEELLNVGPRSSQWLREAGIASVQQLKKMGRVLAYRVVKHARPTASLNLLWALAAGLQNKRWQELTAAEKLRLKQQLEELS